MRTLLIVAGLALVVGVVGLTAKDAKKPDYKTIVESLEAWVAKQEKADNLPEKDLEEVSGLVKSLEALTAKQIFDGLSDEERAKLLALLEKDDRLTGYADRVTRIADDVGLSVDQTEGLLDVYSDWREKRREVWNDRDARSEAEKTFEKKVTKLLGRSKAKAVLNAIRRMDSGRRRGR